MSKRPVVVSAALAAHRPDCRSVKNLKNPRNGVVSIAGRRLVVEFEDGEGGDSRWPDFVWAPGCCGRYLWTEAVETYGWRYDVNDF